MASKNSLLTQFLSEHLSITLDSKTSIQMGSGEVVDVQMLLDGTLIDFDDEFLMLGQPGSEAVELVKRDLILGLRIIDDNDTVMNDPTKPDKGSMN
jgi:hypothetical protein